MLFLAASVARAQEDSSSVAPATAPAAQRDLIVHGSDKRVWVARVGPSSIGQGIETAIYYRDVGPAETWKPLARPGARVVAMTHRGSNLAVLFESGQMSLFWPRGSQIVPALPGRAKILAMAGDDDALWAVAPYPGGAAAVPKRVAASRPATRPTTLRAVVADDAPIESRVPRLVLFVLQREEWVPLADFPDDAFVAHDSPMSMEIVAHQPTVAFRMTGGTVRVLRFTRQGTWEDAGMLAPGFLATDLKILENNHAPALWAAQRKSAGEVTYDAGGWSSPVPLQPPPGADLSHRDVAIASDRLRLMWLGESKVFEQRYDTDGKAAGEPVQLELRDMSADTRLVAWVNSVVVGALVIAIIASVLRRRASAEATLAAPTFALAPLSARFYAGLIDLIPVVATEIYVASHLGMNENPLERASDPQALWTLLLGWAAYLLHTTVCEMISGRSIGKMMFGLRVVSLKNTRPGLGSLLMRNLLRVIDLGMAFLPLFLIFYSPLNQRAGDVAAGTIVITERPREDEQSPDSMYE